jgi:hypothetical protein
MFNLGGNRIALDKILMKDERLALIPLVNGGTAYNLMRCGKNHTALIKVIIPLSVPKLSTQFCYKRYLVKRRYIANRQQAQVNAFFPGIQQSNERMSRSGNNKHTMYLSDRLQFTDFGLFAFHV